MSNYDNTSVARMAGYFKALAHPHRLRIFLQLSARCRLGVGCCPESTVSACVGELGRPLKISPSTVSHHLKELRQSGLLKMARRGKNVDCWVDPQVLRDLALLFSPDACGLPARPARRAAKAKEAARA
jgi:ArsR family transcriptional regulator